MNLIHIKRNGYLIIAAAVIATKAGRAQSGVIVICAASDLRIYARHESYGKRLNRAVYCVTHFGTMLPRI
jgi:hypothetical protein